MGINIEYVLNEINFDEKLINVFNTYTKYINFRFDYVIRTSLTQLPDELDHNIDYSEFDPNNQILLDCINSNSNVDNVTKLKEELKKLITEVKMRRKEINIIAINEDGLKKNIKHLEDIISIKENFICETANYADIRCNAKEKVLKEYNKTNKKYSKILNQLNKTNKAMKMSTSNETSKHSDYSERLSDRALRYEAKIKRMDDIIKIAGDSKEKLLQYQIALQTSKDRLKIFCDQLNSQLKNKQLLTTLLSENEKRILQLKTNLSNLGVLSSIEKSRVHTSSNLIENDNLKKEFLELQNMRNEILSSRPRGMFNPKYQKENSLTKEEIRKYLENDEVIDSIDYLIELKNNEVHNSDTNLLKHIKTNTNEETVLLKCLSTLSLDEIKQLLIHFYIKVVDVKESGRENDEIISKLDEINDKQKHSIVSLNNNYQEFHLSIEKKFMALKKYYQAKLNMLFQLVQEDSNAITVFKMRQEITTLKKKVTELEKSQMTKLKEPLVTPEPIHHKSTELDASKSGSETMSSAKVTYHKNKLKIQKNKSKLN